MIRKSKSTKVLSGTFCLPTSARAHLHEPKRCTAFYPGMMSYLLVATQSVDDGGYPPQVVLTSPEPLEGFELDAEVATQHAQVRKNLPPRRVAAIVDSEGNVQGDLSTAPRGLGLPHWEYVPANEDGSANLGVINATAQRIADNKAQAQAERVAIKAAKSGAKA